MYRQYYPQVLAYISRRTNSQIAADLAAEAFLRAWRGYAGLNGQPLPWLYGIARNVVLEHYRASDRKDELTQGAKAQMIAREEQSPTAWGSTDRVDQAMEIGSVLGALSAADREILLLNCWEDLSPADIAHVLEISPSSARVRLHRARHRFQEAYVASASPTSSLSTGGQS